MANAAEKQATPYGGKERRRHRIYVTKNTEYHFRDGFCVAVRDRRTGDFLQGHLALRRRIHGGLRVFANGALKPNMGEPQAGEALCFLTGGRDLVTSPLERVDRPSQDLVKAYPDLSVPARVDDDEDDPNWGVIDDFTGSADDNDLFG
jgi:hypothetical protein